MRTRTKGIQLVGDERIIEKQYHGVRIFQRLGKISQDDAEAWLRGRQAEIDNDRERELRTGNSRLFADGAAKYLIECKAKGVRTLDTISYHVTLLLPYIGRLPMPLVCNESLESFVADRLEDGVKNATINRSLEVARTITNRAARVWRDNGKPWIPSPPLIEMMDETAQRRQPYPITWAQQAALVPALPGHLQRPVLFALNTGARDDNICGLRWDWEVKVPELGRSVFVVPAEEFKGQRDHVLILNDAAWSIVESCRGRHEDYVFVYRRERVKHLDRPPEMEYRRIDTINNTAFQRVRAEVGLEKMRVHDLRHTFGQRLRDAGVTEEDRALLLGHAIEGMPQHYATATVARLVEAANKAQYTVDRTTLLRVVNG
ncbi:phage integrase family protein [Polaromonas sp. CF318]|uniref:tyrosine-type recombinase/integrase n=1 Tax=Polaromonas sp. CF318 TaxID=1144318 RepID=UPI0002710FA2|nr:tyrosine-type recombinase/integrase [Polaromonas sp. CF318]EJL90458.1 phage integrase family protein [Polaromonas sp. CF318]